MTDPICPDCIAEERVTPCSIARRDGTRGVINLVETVHEPTCPHYQGVTP